MSLLAKHRFSHVHINKRTESDHTYCVHFDCGAYFLIKNTELAVAYLNKCLEEDPTDSKVLFLLSVCKRSLADLDAALKYVLEAEKIESHSPGINLEICDCLYDKNQFETCMIELHNNTRKYLSAVVNDFKDRIIVVSQNLQDCLGDSLDSFVCKHSKIFPQIVEVMKREKMVEKRPLWKIRKDDGECDVQSVKDKEECLLSPLEIARRNRMYRIFSQIYIGKSWVDEAFLRAVPKDDKHLHHLINSEYPKVKKFMRMLHARSPLYNEYYQRFGDQKFLKRNREQYLYKLQLQTRKKMFTILKTITQFRKTGNLKGISKYVEDAMEDFVTLKTFRVMPWKFEFVNEVYNRIGLAHADRYIMPENVLFKSSNPFDQLQQLLKVPNVQPLQPLGFIFGNRSTYILPDAVDPIYEKYKKHLSRLEKSLIFAKYSIEKCYILYEMARTYFIQYRYDECNSKAKRAIEESKNCNSFLYNFLSMMLIVKTYSYLRKVEHCHDAILEAVDVANHLKDPKISAFMQNILSISDGILTWKKNLITAEVRRRSTKSVTNISDSHTEVSSWESKSLE